MNISNSSQARNLVTDNSTLPVDFTEFDFALAINSITRNKTLQENLNRYVTATVLVYKCTLIEVDGVQSYDVNMLYYDLTPCT